MARENDERLTNEFNRRLGRRSERARKANRPRSIASKRVASGQSVRQGRRGSIARTNLGTQKLPSDVKKAFKRQFGGGRNGAAAAKSFQQTLNGIVDEAIGDLRQREFTEKAIAKAMETAPVGGTGERDKPGLMDFAINTMRNIPGPGALLGSGSPVGNFVDNVNAQNAPPEEEGRPYWQALMENHDRSPVGRAMDIVSRPAYGLFEGMQNAIEQPAERREAGEDPGYFERVGNSLTDFGSGFGAGFTGKEKTGFGQVYETGKNTGTDFLSEGMRNFEKEHPTAEQWVARTVGLGGEIGLDPTNIVSGGTASVLRNTGEQLTEATGKAAVRQIADDVARRFWDDAVAHTGGLRYKPSQDAMADYAARAAESALEKSMLEVKAGTYAGNVRMGSAQHAATAGNQVAETIRREMFRSFDNRIQKMERAFNQGGRLAPHSWRVHMAQSPEFEDMVDLAYNKWVTAKTKKNPQFVVPSRGDWLASRTANDIDSFREAAQQVRHSIHADLTDVVDEVVQRSNELYYNTIGLRIGKKTIPFKTIGKAYAAVKKVDPAAVARRGKPTARENAVMSARNFGESMSFERMAPGRLSLQTQAGRSIGVKAFESYRDNLIKVARSITQDEDKLIMRALEDSSITLPPKLEQIRLSLRKDLLAMHNQEIASGARADGDVIADDYAFIFNRGGSKDARTRFKDERKRTVKSTKGSVGKYTIEYAKKEGLNPVDGAMEMMLARKLKSTRDIARATFMEDLVNTYGFNAQKLTRAEALSRKVTEIPHVQLPQALRKVVDKDGSGFYLPDEHMALYRKYMDTVGWSPTNEGQFIRTWAKMTNLVKYFSTVPRPGFHIRNMLGDFFMGLMDDVPTKTYGEVLRKAEQATIHKKPVSFRISEKINLTWDELKALYDTHANSGFFDTELPLGGATPTAGQFANNARKRVSNKMREASDWREDYGRIVHFVSALRQEADGFVKAGITDPKKLLERATESAVWRVNKYKFDYGALTAAERKIKLLFPFYTFTRKAAPTLMQQLWMNPRYLGLSGRFMEYNDGSAADNFNHYYLPEYLKDTGYAMLNDEEEPLYMDMGVNPASVLNSLDFTNAQQFGQSVAQQTNPLLQIPFEVGGNKDVFTGRPTGDFQDYLKTSFFAEDIANEFTPGGNDDPWWLQMMNEGYAGANLGVRQFGTEQQDYGYREMEDRFIQDPFSEFNRSQDRYRVYQSNRRNGNSFRLEDTTTGQIIMEATDPRQILDRAKSLL